MGLLERRLSRRESAGGAPAGGDPPSSGGVDSSRRGSLLGALRTESRSDGTRKSKVSIGLGAGSEERMPSVAALVASPAVRRATGKKAPLSDDIAARSSSKTPDPSTGRPASRPRSSRSGKNQRMRFSEADGDGDGDEEAGEKQAARAESPATAGSERRAGGGSKKRFVGLSVSVGKHSDEEAAPAAAAASLPSKSTSPPQSPPSVSAAAGRSPGGIPSSPAMASAPSSRPTFKRMATFSTGKRQMTDYESALATAQARRESMWTTGATAPTSAALSPAGSLPGSPRGQRSATATQRERGTSIAGTSVAPHRAGIPSGAHIPSTSAHMGHRRGDLDANAAAAAAATAAAANAGGGMTFRHLPAALTARGGQQDNNQVVFEFMDSVLSQDTGGAAAALLEKGRASAATLFFGDAGFEREFRRDYAGEGIVRSRLCAVGALLICALLAGYALLLSDRPRQSALGYAGAAISAALALAVYASPLARRHPIVSHNLVTALFCLALVAGTSYTRLATTDTDAPMVAPVAIVALTVICRVLVSFSFFANLAMAGILLGTTAGYVSPLQALFHTVPPLEVIVLVLVIGRALEAVSRRNFLLGRLSRETQAMASAEKAKGDKILQSVLPESVIAAWKAGREQTVNRAFEEVTILFVALSNPPRTTAQNLAAVMPRINRYMSRLEDICDRHGVFRIKTIGFLFMAACGLPEERPEDHALAAARFARDALAMARDSGFSIKVGLHCGPIVAGLIGCRVFYDVFGDTVNVAQRMCYYAAPDSARFSARMHERVRAQAAAGGAKGEAFDFGPAEEMTIKGKGAMVTYPLRVPDSDDDEEDEEEGTSGESAAESGSEVPSSGSEAAAAPVAAEAGPAEAKRAEAVAGEGKVASPASVPALPLGAGPWQTSPSPAAPAPAAAAAPAAVGHGTARRRAASLPVPALNLTALLGPAAAAAAAAAQPTAAQPAGAQPAGAQLGAASRRSSAAKSRRTSQPEHSRRGSQPEHSRRGSQPEHGRSVRASRRRGSIMDAPAELLFGPGGAPHVEPAELRGEEAAAAAAAAVAPPAAGPLLLPGPEEAVPAVRSGASLSGAEKEEGAAPAPAQPELLPATATETEPDAPKAEARPAPARRRRRRRAPAAAVAPAPVPPAASAAAVAAPPPVELPSSISDRIKRAATATVRSVMALARMPRVHSSLPLSPVQLRGVLGVLSRRPGQAAPPPLRAVPEGKVAPGEVVVFCDPREAPAGAAASGSEGSWTDATASSDSEASPAPGRPGASAPVWPAPRAAAAAEGGAGAVAAGAAPAKVGPTSPLASSSSGRSEGAGAAAPAKGEESGGEGEASPGGAAADGAGGRRVSAAAREAAVALLAAALSPPAAPAPALYSPLPAPRRASAPDPSDPAWSRIVAAGPGGARAHRRRASLPHALPLAGGGPYLLGASRSFGGTGTARAAAEGARRRSDAPKSAGGSKIPSIDIVRSGLDPVRLRGGEWRRRRSLSMEERRRAAAGAAASGNASGTSGAASPVHARGARTAARAFRSRSVLVGQAARKAPTLGASASPAARAGDDSLAAFLHVAGAPRALAGSPARGASPAPGPLNAAPGRGSAVASLPILRPLSSGEVAPLSPPFTVPASPPSHVPSPPLALAAAPAAPSPSAAAAAAARPHTPLNLGKIDRGNEDDDALQTLRRVLGPSGGAATARGTAGGAATARGTAGGAATARGTTGGGTTRRQSTTRTNRGNATARGGPLTARGAAPLTARGPRSSTLSPPPNDGATGTEASGPRQSYQSDRSRPSHVSLRSLSSARLSSPEGPPPAPAVPATPLNAPSSVVSGLGLGTVGALGTGGTAGLATLVVGPMANGKPRSTSSDLTLGANGGSARSRPGAAPRSAAGTSGRHVTLSDGGLSTARLSSRFKPPSVAGSLGAGVRPGSVPSLKALAAPSPQLQPARGGPAPPELPVTPASPARAAPVAPAPAEVAAPAPAPHAAEPALATGRKRPSVGFSPASLQAAAAAAATSDPEAGTPGAGAAGAGRGPAGTRWGRALAALGVQPRHLAAMRGAVHCRFVDGALEAEFWDRVPRASLPDTRTVLALVFAHTLLWPAVQYGSGVPGDLPARLLVRYALQGTCVAAALALALFARAPFTRHARWVVNALSAVLVANAAISVLLFDRREAGAAAELAASFSYADLFIVLFIIHTFPGPVAPWLDTLVFDLALIGVSLASSGLARARPGRALLNLLLVEAICVSAAWFKELEARVEFLLDRELKAETEELAFECGETERLLQLCLPAPVALGVKDSSNGAKPTFYERVGVLTADIVGFTPLSSSLSAGELVDMLDTIYRKLDMLAAERNIHVLKTIGDAWIAVAGLDEPVSEEAMVEMVDLGAAVVQTFKQYAANSGRPVSVRVGIALASASGGIIGNKKWFWDLFGEAMEAAQRLESSSLPLRVHISRDVADCIADVFAVEPRYADPAAAPPALADLGDTFFVATSSAS